VKYCRPVLRKLIIAILKFCFLSYPPDVPGAVAVSSHRVIPPK
jgi:hypothetical protein